MVGMKKRIITAMAFLAVLSPFGANAAGTAVEKIRLFDNAGNIIYYNYEEITVKPKIFVNNSGEAFNTKTVTAKFENDRLCEVKISPVTVPSGEGEVEIEYEILLSTDCEVRVALLKQNSFTVSGDMYFYKSVPDIPVQSGGYAQPSGYSRELRKALKKLDESIDGKSILDFYASLYDADTAMFYSCTSGKYSYGFHPNIEVTSQIYDFVRGAGNLTDDGINQRLSAEQKQKMLAFLTDMYDPSTENFYHPDAPKGTATTGRISRDISWAKKYILPYCGLTYSQFKNSYPNTLSLLSYATLLSTENVIDRYKAAQTIEECNQVLEDYWTEQTVTLGNHPYSMGDTFGGLSSAASAKGSEYYKALCSFVVSKQNTQTGLWGDNADYKGVSAAMKFAGYFKGVGEGYLHYDKMIESCIEVILSDEVPQYIVYIWNPLSAMQQARNNFEAVSKPVPHDFDERVIAAMPDIIDKSLEKISKFKRHDGGYSYEEYEASAAIQSMPIGLGLCESDVDGTGKIRGVKTAVYSLLSLKSKAFLSSADISEFFEKLQSAKPTEKNTNKTYLDDFEGYTLGEKPDKWSQVFVGTNTNGYVRLVQDPENSANKCLAVTGGKHTRIKTKTGGFSMVSENGEVQYTEFDLMISTGTKFIYNITLGNEGIRFYLESNSAKNKYGLNIVNGANGWGQTVKTLNCDTWYKIRVEYLPVDKENTSVKIFVDNIEQTGTWGYFGQGATPQKNPKKSIAGFTVSANDASEGGIVYVDNLKAYVK